MNRICKRCLEPKGRHYLWDEYDKAYIKYIDATHLADFNLAEYYFNKKEMLRYNGLDTTYFHPFSAMNNLEYLEYQYEKIQKQV